MVCMIEVLARECELDVKSFILKDSFIDSITTVDQA